jgi:hypothetical protein
MLLSQLLAFGSLAVAQAFLLPPSISSIDSDIVNALPFEVESSAKANSLSLECTNCPVAVPQPIGATKWVQGVASKLQLNFEIQTGDADTLWLNGLPIYPVSALMATQPLMAIQVTETSAEELRLGYELKVDHPSTTDAALQLVRVRLQIVEVADKFVDGLESVEVEMVETPARKLMIASVKTAPTTNPSGANCQTLVCILRKIIEGKIASAKGAMGKGCGGRMGMGGKAKGGRPHGHEGHRGHRHHGLARVLHAFKSIAVHVIVPIIVGIVAGFTVSLIGMMVGHTVVFLWRAVFRRGCARKGACGSGRKGSYVLVAPDEIVAQGNDKREDMEVAEAPPGYDDVVGEKV